MNKMNNEIRMQKKLEHTVSLMRDEQITWNNKLAAVKQKINKETFEGEKLSKAKHDNKLELKNLKLQIKKPAKYHPI
jgi:hypothetical protein